jgi:hypothetical protein
MERNCLSRHITLWRSLKAPSPLESRGALWPRGRPRRGHPVARLSCPREFARPSRTHKMRVEGAHSNLARKPKGWLEHEIRHAAETREA